jgi:quinol monooxygenase YgiN
MVSIHLISASTTDGGKDMGYAIAARWVAKPGEEDHLLELIKDVAVSSRQEPGCKLYQPTRDPDNPRNFFFFEVYEDEAAFTAHTQSPHFTKHVLDDALGRLEERERTAYQTID